MKNHDIAESKDIFTHPEQDAAKQLKDIEKGYKMLKLNTPEPQNDSAEESDSEHVSSEFMSKESFSEALESMSAPDLDNDRSIKISKENQLVENSKFYE